MINHSTEKTKQLMVRVVDSAAEFLNACEDWLYESEVTNTHLLSIAASIESEKGQVDPPFWFAIVFDGENIVGSALHVVPDGLCLSDLSATAAHAVADEFSRTEILPDRVSGPDDACAAVCSALENIQQVAYSPAKQWQSFVTSHLIPPTRPVPGVMRPALSDDRDIIVEYGMLYGKGEATVVDIASYFLRKQSDSLLYAWDNNGIKTLIAMSAHTKNSIRIAAVFTPPEHRCHGYASSAIFEVSKHYIESGCKFCHLVVDRSEPNVMSVYENIGYEKFDSRAEMRRTSLGAP